MALTPSGSYHHRIAYERPDEYVISWRTYSKTSGSRLLFSNSHWRDTNRRGAERFAKKWHIPMPPEADGDPSPKKKGKR